MLATFVSHAWHFFFQPGHGSQWYEGNVYGNLVAIVPSGVLLWLYLRSRHLAILTAHAELKAAHVDHAEKLDKLLNKLDPDTRGGITDVLNRLEVSTPGGIQLLDAKVERIGQSIANLHSKSDTIDTRLATKRSPVAGARSVSDTPSKGTT